MRVLAPIALALLTGCAITPEQMAQKTPWDVCRFTMGGPNAQVAEYERERRSLDCVPLYPAIAAQNAAQSAAAASYFRATQPQPNRPMNCSSYQVGNRTETTCR